MFFHQVPEAAPDKVFGLTGVFAADPRINKVDLLVGIYKNEELKSEIMPSVKQAKKEIWDQLADYLPMDGLKECTEALGALLFGKSLWQQGKDHIYGAQAVGGTGALRVGAEFIAQEVTKGIYVPQPTWPNHNAIFERAGLRVETIPYYDRTIRGFDAKAFLSFLAKIPSKSAVLLHATCHNPTGCDPKKAEWEEIARVMKERELLPFFDCAYQGFGEGIDQDAEAVRVFAKEGLEFLVAYSCSKNFSLYSQRIGALFVVDQNAAVRQRVGSQIKRIIRALYSNPPAHGARIVAHILNGDLRGQWEQELQGMRERLQSMRRELVERLMAKAKKTDFRHLLDHQGMFSFIDLEKSQVDALIDQYAIYMLQNGRISVAGLNKKNLEAVAEGIIAVKEA